jgi:hypothetical protein
MFLCTLKKGIFGLISEGLIIVRIRQVKEKNFFGHILGFLKQIFRQIYEILKDRKNVSCLCKREIYRIY